MKKRYNINIDKDIHDKAVKACKLMSENDNHYYSLSSVIEKSLESYIKNVEFDLMVKI